MRTIGLVCMVLFAQTAVPQNVGWKGYLTENPTEFHDLPLSWEQDTPVPSWLSGTYVRNGPSQVTLSRYMYVFQILNFFIQISFDSPRRVLTSWLDGFAKLQSFKMSGSNILYR